MISFNDIQAEIIDALSGLVAIPSIKADPLPGMPFGEKIADALDYVKCISEKLGFEFVNLNNYLGYIEYGKGEELLLIITHIDVVPAGDGWIHPCYELSEDDGMLYGRGVTDDKGAAIVSLYALYLIKENHIPIKKRIRVLFGCDEECGWGDMEYYKSVFPDEPEMAFSPDADFPIINYEKGLLHLNLKSNSYSADGYGVRLITLDGGSRINIVPDTAVCVIRGKVDVIVKALEYYNEAFDDCLFYSIKGPDICITANGVSSHGSRPEDGKNAIMLLVGFLYNLPLIKSASSNAVYMLGDYFLEDVNGSKIGMAYEDESGKVTVNIGIVHLTETSADISMDIRYPVVTSRNAILDKISSVFDGYCLTILHDKMPHYVSPDSELVRTLLNIYNECTGSNSCCQSCGGATFARAFENSVAYGIQFPGFDGREHMCDERMLTADLMKSGEIIYKAMERLCYE